MAPQATAKPGRLVAGALVVGVLIAAVAWLVIPSTQTIEHRHAPRRQRSQPHGQLFAPGSVWNAAIPANAAIDPSSPRMVTVLDAEVSSELQSGVGPWIATSKASTPLYVVSRNQPVVRVRLDAPTVAWRSSLQRAFAAVPVPARARPASGSDAQMTVWQPATDKLWEFFHMRLESDGWHAAWGGAMDDVSSSPGYYTTSSWPGALPQWGATATSLPLVGGLMTLRELRAGVIHHALSIALPAPRAGVFARPAERSDGTGGPDTIPEGARLRLDPHLDLARLSLPPLTRMIALAAQRYGMIVRDQTHEGISLYAEDPTPYGGAGMYYGPRGIFGGQTPQRLLASFPWSHLQVMKLHLSHATTS